jgi:hypothetical protein
MTRFDLQPLYECYYLSTDLLMAVTISLCYALFWASGLLKLFWKHIWKQKRPLACETGLVVLCFLKTVEYSAQIYLYKLCPFSAEANWQVRSANFVLVWIRKVIAPTVADALFVVLLCGYEHLTERIGRERKGLIVLVVFFNFVLTLSVDVDNSPTGMIRLIYTAKALIAILCLALSVLSMMMNANAIESLQDYFHSEDGAFLRLMLEQQLKFLANKFQACSTLTGAFYLILTF